MSLRDHTCFADLAEDLRKLSAGKPIVEIVNSGNWGDALIHAGQAEFLRDMGIEVERMPVRDFRRLSKGLKGKIRSWRLPRHAIITGCGAFRDFYDRPAEFSAAAKFFEHVLVMPSSLPFAPDLDPRRTTLWRRDALESMNGAPAARFCHDMAFYLRPAPRQTERTHGVFFRTDREKADTPLPQGNLDLSNEGTHKSDIEPFLDAIGACEVVHTNRLHVGIGGALLGREVHLYASRTSKLQSIFEASLKPFYQDVHYHSEPSAISDLCQHLEAGGA